MNQYTRIRAPRGLTTATVIMIGLAWIQMAVGLGGGVVVPTVQTAVVVALFVLTVLCPRAKIALVQYVQKWVINPVVRALFSAGINPLGLVILETTGRSTGRPRRVPVGNGRCGNSFWVIAEHGHDASYVRNIRHDPRVRIRTRVGLRYRWVDGVAEIRADEDALARQRAIMAWHPLRALNALNVRTLGGDLLCVHIALDVKASGPTRTAQASASSTAGSTPAAIAA